VTIPARINVRLLFARRDAMRLLIRKCAFSTRTASNAAPAFMPATRGQLPGIIRNPDMGLALSWDKYEF